MSAQRSPQHHQTADSGLYVLWLDLPRAASVSVGSLGTCHFEPGLYAYVGSARRARSARIARHLRIGKRHHWHIDYLRPAGDIVAVTYVDTPDLGECRLAEHLISNLEGRRAIPGFGASDCRCGGHLLRFHDPKAWHRFPAALATATTLPVNPCYAPRPTTGAPSHHIRYAIPSRYRSKGIRNQDSEVASAQAAARREVAAPTDEAAPTGG